MKRKIFPVAMCMAMLSVTSCEHSGSNKAKPAKKAPVTNESDNTEAIEQEKEEQALLKATKLATEKAKSTLAVIYALEEKLETEFDTEVRLDGDEYQVKYGRIATIGGIDLVADTLTRDSVAKKRTATLKEYTNEISNYLCSYVKADTKFMRSTFSTGKVLSKKVKDISLQLDFDTEVETCDFENIAEQEMSKYLAIDTDAEVKLADIAVQEKELNNNHDIELLATTDSKTQDTDYRVKKDRLFSISNFDIGFSGKLTTKKKKEALESDLNSYVDSVSSLLCDYPQDTFNVPQREVLESKLDAMIKYMEVEKTDC